MVEEVIVRQDEFEPMLDMTIHWKGDIHTCIRFKKPTRGNPPVNKTNDEVIELVQKLAPHHTDEEIAMNAGKTWIEVIPSLERDVDVEYGEGFDNDAVIPIEAEGSSKK